MTIRIRDAIDQLFDRINAISLPGPGYTRPSYSSLETQAHEVAYNYAKSLGLEVSRDSGLNLFARLPGRNPNATPLFMGSHLDTVSNGGAYDGVAGVVGALALAADLVTADERPPADLVVAVTRAEESVWFPVSYIGSRAALNRLEPNDLKARRVDTGRTLAEHIRDEGGDPEAILRGPGLRPARFLELHIEQGPVLERAGEPFAVVSGVRGGLRYRQATIHGVWAHSGGAPREARADAVLAFADLAMAMDRAWSEILASGEDIALTFGRVDAATAEHAFAKVPGRVDFCVDLRSDRVAILDRADDILKAEVARVERERSVRFDLGPMSRSAPSALSLDLGTAFGNAAKSLGYSARMMLSGGGHDAAAFAAAGWQSSMVFLRNKNGSHNPDEAMDPVDLADAVRALRVALPALQSDAFS
jgi:beta-ureidopropionase / N-carbamoyl-L-amino-acid hydrolase